MKSESLASYVFLAQAVGLVFFIILVAAYFGDMPSSGNLIGTSAFRTSLSIFGGVFLILAVAALLAAALVKQKD